jgi:superfamily II DNA/RNA helicase
LSQAVRQKNLSRFSSGRVRVLVATDIAARGIHVDDVSLVVHVDPPTEHKAYVHRSGRTARAGNEGIVVTVATNQEHGSVKTLMKRAGITAVMRPVTPGHQAISDVSGPPAARVEPPVRQAEPEPVRGSRPSRPRPARAQGDDRRPRTDRSSGRPRQGGAPRRDDGGTRPARTERTERTERSQRSGATTGGSREERRAAQFSSDRPARRNTEQGRGNGRPQGQGNSGPRRSASTTSAPQRRRRAS